MELQIFSGDCHRIFSILIPLNSVCQKVNDQSRVKDQKVSFHLWIKEVAKYVRMDKKSQYEEAEQLG